MNKQRTLEQRRLAAEKTRANDKRAFELMRETGDTFEQCWLIALEETKRREK